MPKQISENKDFMHLTTGRYKSPFYEGRTMFGGSSARISRPSPTMSPYAVAKHSTYLTRIKESDIKRSESNQPLSNSVKNILKNMDLIPSPVQDAKRMPLIGSSFSSSIFEPSKPFRRQSASKNIILPTSQAGLSSISQKPIMKWDHSSSSSPLSNNTSPKNFNANLVKEDRVIDLEPRESNLAVGSGGGKMRQKVCSARQRASKTDDIVEELIEYPNVPLPIKNLPSFSFAKKDDFSSLATKSSAGTEKRSYLEMMSAEHEAEFNFSAPKMVKYALMRMKTSKNLKEETAVKPSTSSSFPSQAQQTLSSSNRGPLNADLKNMNPPSAQAIKFAETISPPNSAKETVPKLPQSGTGTAGNIPEEKSSMNKSAQKSTSLMFAIAPNTWECEIRDLNSVL